MQIVGTIHLFYPESNVSYILIGFAFCIVIGTLAGFIFSIILGIRLIKSGSLTFRGKMIMHKSSNNFKKTVIVASIGILGILAGAIAGSMLALLLFIIVLIIALVINGALQLMIAVGVIR
jgi:uncharacterized membrane protein HdeD (DUF308 family)